MLVPIVTQPKGLRSSRLYNIFKHFPTRPIYEPLLYLVSKPFICHGQQQSLIRLLVRLFSGVVCLWPSPNAILFLKGDIARCLFVRRTSHEFDICPVLQPRPAWQHKYCRMHVNLANPSP